jgi:hypothetical protein
MNKIKAIGALAVPVLRYSFGIINWRLEEIKQIDRKTRKMLTIYKMHHPKPDIHKLYVNRKEEGRGLVQIEAAYKTEIINIPKYLNTTYKGDRFVNIFLKTMKANSIIKSAAKITEDLRQLNGKNDAKQDKIQHTKAKLGEVLKKNWKTKQCMGNTYEI